jgi:hypothetical protein
MPQNIPTKTNSNDKEPAFSIQLSKAEIIALIKWHTAESRAISKRFGQAVFKMQTKTTFGSSRDVMMLKRVCQDEIEKHHVRAKGLLALIQ